MKKLAVIVFVAFLPLDIPISLIVGAFMALGEDHS